MPCFPLETPWLCRLSFFTMTRMTYGGLWNPGLPPRTFHSATRDKAQAENIPEVKNQEEWGDGLSHLRTETEAKSQEGICLQDRAVKASGFIRHLDPSPRSFWMIPGVITPETWSMESESHMKPQLWLGKSWGTASVPQAFLRVSPGWQPVSPEWHLARDLYMEYSTLRHLDIYTVTLPRCPTSDLSRFSIMQVSRASCMDKDPTFVKSLHVQNLQVPQFNALLTTF